MASVNFNLTQYSQPQLSSPAEQMELYGMFQSAGAGLQYEVQCCVLKALTSVHQIHNVILTDGNAGINHADSTLPTPKSHITANSVCSFTWAQAAAMLRWLAEILHRSRRKTLDLHHATGKLSNRLGC